MSWTACLGLRHQIIYVIYNGSTRSTMIYIREMYIENPEIHEIYSDTKLFIYLFEFKGFFLHEEREAEFLTILTFPSDPHHVLPPTANYWSGLGQLRKSTCFVLTRIWTNSLFFFKSPNPQLGPSGHDVNHVPGPISCLGFLLWHLWLSHQPCACVNTCTQCVHLTNPCTKSKGSLLN